MLYKQKIGVCLDERVAYLLEEKNDENLITIIRADDEESENLRPKKKLRKNEFYRKVFDLIRDFDRISLFGPASSRKEILRLLAVNKISGVDVENDSHDQVTESQKIDFINNYFKNKSKAENH